ncbi:MAG: hypothetical protein R6V62_05585 [Candidatus Fermentibacteraceae bacterium]
MIALLFVHVLVCVPGEQGLFALTGFIPPEERLMPCGVELEHRFLGPDDETWEKELIGITVLSHLWGDDMREMGFGVPYRAPVPLTRDQALLNLPHASEVEGGPILSFLGEHALTYSFDEQNRTCLVDWDPVADSGVYTFRYFYENCSLAAPEWIMGQAGSGP